MYEGRRRARCYKTFQIHELENHILLQELDLSKSHISDIVAMEKTSHSKLFVE